MDLSFPTIYCHPVHNNQLCDSLVVVVVVVNPVFDHLEALDDTKCNESLAYASIVQGGVVDVFGRHYDSVSPFRNVDQAEFWCRFCVDWIYIWSFLLW